MFESTLEKLADKILSLDEASLTALWIKYKDRMERFDASREWEKSVIVFFIINAVRAKNQIFNEKILQRQTQKKETPPGSLKTRPDIKRVK